MQAASEHFVHNVIAVSGSPLPHKAGWVQVPTPP